jgi:hypothetical protein
MDFKHNYCSKSVISPLNLHANQYLHYFSPPYPASCIRHCTTGPRLRAVLTNSMGRRAAVTGVVALLGGLVAALLELLPQDGRNSRDPEVSVRGLPQDGRKLDMLRIPDPPAYPPGASLVAGCRSVRSAPTNIRVGNADIGARSSVHLLHCTHHTCACEGRASSSDVASYASI